MDVTYLLLGGWVVWHHTGDLGDVPTAVLEEVPRLCTVSPGRSDRERVTVRAESECFAAHSKPLRLGHETRADHLVLVRA